MNRSQSYPDQRERDQRDQRENNNISHVRSLNRTHSETLREMNKDYPSSISNENLHLESSELRSTEAETLHSQSFNILVEPVVT